MQHKLAIAACARNEGTYLFEWMVFHVLQGATLFRIYDNYSSDFTPELLRAFGRICPVEYLTWPGEMTADNQRGIYRDAASAIAGRAEFMAAIDVDEFIGNTDREGLRPVLGTFAPEVSAIAVTQRVFGSSGEGEYRPDLVVRRFIRRGEDGGAEHYWFKTICRPERVTDFVTPHACSIDSGLYVTQDGVPIDGRRHGGRTDRLATSNLQLNHYMLKSAAEFRSKQQRWGGLSQPASPYARRVGQAYFDERDREYNARLDVSLASYAPPLELLMKRFFARLSSAPEVQKRLSSCYRFLSE